MKAMKWFIPGLIIPGMSVVLAACGGGQKPAEDPSGETAEAVTAGEEAEPAPEEEEAEKPWAEMDREERMDYMGLVVLPEMQALFTEYDAELYSEFKCQTCHGEDMEQVDFKMPNGLYALPKEGTIESSKDYDAPITEFMMNKVVPKMGELLQKEPGTELTCFTCHETEE